MAQTSWPQGVRAGALALSPMILFDCCDMLHEAWLGAVSERGRLFFLFATEWCYALSQPFCGQKTAVFVRIVATE